MRVERVALRLVAAAGHVVHGKIQVLVAQGHVREDGVYQVLDRVGARRRQPPMTFQHQTRQQAAAQRLGLLHCGQPVQVPSVARQVGNNILQLKRIRKKEEKGEKEEEEKEEKEQESKM